jgi:hypothetical protein
MNLAEHFDKFYQLTGQTSSDFISTDQLINILDDAEREVNHETHYVRKSNIFDSVGNQQEYSLDTYAPGIIDYFVDAVYYSTTDSTERRPLEKISLQELNFINKRWKEDDNVYPRFYYVDRESGILGFHPFEKSVQTGTNCIEIVYRGEHTKMTTYYATGTISITSGTKVVTGSGTSWTNNVSSGDKIGIGKLLDSTTSFPVKWYTIDEVSGNTSLTITSDYAETDASGDYYIIASPSSIDNEILNKCSVYLAMAEHYLIVNDDTRRSSLISEAYIKMNKENRRINKNHYPNKVNVPAGNYPFPGHLRGDYRNA